ncbi:UvrD-helicase domain-containing protein [Nocardia sp. NPDC055321]
MQAAGVLAAIGPMGTRQRNVLSGLLADGRRGWHLLVRDGGNGAQEYADAFLIGPGGVFALVFGDAIPSDPIVQKLRVHAEQHFADLPLGQRGNVFVSETIELVLVIAPRARIHSDGRYRVVSEIDYRTLLDSGNRVDRGLAGRIAEAVAARGGGYSLVSLSLRNGRGDPSEPLGLGLLDPSDVLTAERARALEKPFPEWMTFLDPEQRVLVARHYNGPARIAGPAGTGKTVVALHRMAYRARRSTGRLLFTTFVRNLPPCQQRAFGQLVPGAEHRAEFKSLHSWAGDLLESRGREAEMDLKRADNAFNLAWSRVGSRGPLADIERDNRYWREEIDRLIKGRGITEFDEYAKLVRRGRNGTLRQPARKAVWELYEQYEKLRAESGFLDANDLIRLALDELRQRPLDEPYEMVVVDEVQDMTVMGLRLAHAIAGDAPNALLLVGDGQQRVYAGGWRLSDAGISIVGRGELLRVNYRNCEAVLALAASLEGKDGIEDLDGAAGIALSGSEGALGGGTAETWSGSAKDVEAQVLSRLRKLDSEGFPLSTIALITRTNREADRFRVALRRWDIAFRNLEDYDASDEDMIKVGTVYRAKGLDFRAVVHPYFVKSAPDSEPGKESDSARDRAELATNQRFVAITRGREYVWLGIVSG